MLGALIRRWEGLQAAGTVMHGLSALLLFPARVEEAIHLCDGHKMVIVSEEEEVHHANGGIV